MVRNSIILLLVCSTFAFGGRKFTSGGEKIRPFDRIQGPFDGWSGLLTPGNAPNVGHDAAKKYSGNYSLGFNQSGCGPGFTIGWGEVWKDLSGLTLPVFVRIRWHFDGFPDPGAGFCAASSSIFFRAVGTTDSIQLRLTTTKHIALYVNGSQKAITTGVLTVATWYLIQFRTDWTSLHTMRIGLAGSNETITDNTHLSGSPTRFGFGQIQNSWSAVGSNMDDIAINDSSGPYENSYPSDSGKVILLPPLSDSARGNWVAGGGSTTSLFRGVRRSPDSLGCNWNTDTTGIHNRIANANDNVFFNCQSYSTAGIVAANRILLVQTMVMAADSSASGSIDGATSVSSNPAQGGETTFTFGGGFKLPSIATCNSQTAFDPSGWAYAYSDPVYLPAVALATQPVLMIGKRTATTNEALVYQANILVEYSLTGGQDVQVITY